jgi:hypothetical protein
MPIFRYDTLVYNFTEELNIEEINGYLNNNKKIVIYAPILKNETLLYQAKILNI